MIKFLLPLGMSMLYHPLLTFMTIQRWPYLNSLVALRSSLGRIKGLISHDSRWFWQDFKIPFHRSWIWGGGKQEELERGKEDGNYASAVLLCKILRKVNEIISCFYPWKSRWSPFHPTWGQVPKWPHVISSFLGAHTWHTKGTSWPKDILTLLLVLRAMEAYSR